MIEKRDVQLTPVGGYKPDVMLPSGTLHSLPGVQSLPQALSIKEVFSVFRRQWLGMILIVLGALAFGYYSVKSATRIFRSETSMLVEGARGEGANDPVTVNSVGVRQMDLMTQIQVLQSMKVRMDTFALAGIKNYSGMDVANEVYPSISAEPVGESSVIKVTVESSDPDYAEAVARNITDVYRGYVKTTRQGEIEATKENLEKQLASVKKELRIAEQQLVDYKGSRALLPLEGEGGLRSGTAATTESQVKTAEADVIAAQRRLDSLTQKKREVSSKLKIDSKVSNQREIESQKAEIAKLKSEREVLLKRYMPEHESVIAKDIEIKSAETRLETIPKMIDESRIEDHPFILDYTRQITQAQTELDGANARLGRLRAWASQAERQFIDYSKNAPDQSRLEQDVRDRKATIDWITRQVDDLRVRQLSARDPVVVLAPYSKASIIRPRPAQYMALALLFGVFVAIAFALVKDSLDDKIASADEVFRLTGLPLLGEVFPLPNKIRLVNNSTLNPRYIERYRVLRFNLGLLLAKNPARSILVTSPGRYEGKTEVACNLAFSAAEGESRRVILIDADFRRPGVHRRFGLAEKPGLADILLGQATLEEALQPGPIPGLQIIASGGTIANPVDLLAMPQMVDLLAKLEGLCDLVVFDTPASTGLADAHVLARVADSVLCVSKTGRTRRSALRKGIEAFRQASVRVLGVVEVAERTR